MSDNLYPAIEAACKLIAYDNGAVHRHQTELSVVQTMKMKLKQHYPLEQLNEAERQLAAMSTEELDEFCCGERTGPDKEPKLADEVLNYAFEAMP